MQRIFKRGRVWYGWFYEDGRRVVRTTRCRDRAAAERVARQWELDAADPDHAAARTATLTDALQLLLARDEEEVQAGRRSPDTVAFHRSKAGHLVRLFETADGGGHVPFPLARLRAANVDGYVSRRRAEKVTDATIAKELVVLRKSLRLAIRAGLWKGRVEEVIPVAFSAGLRAADPRAHGRRGGEAPPRAPPGPRRAGGLHRRDLGLLAGVGAGPARGRRRGARDGAPPRHEAEDALPDRAHRRARRSARSSSTRVEHAQGTGGAVFRVWRNARRDLLEACERAGIERCSPNDLRRTFASWQVEAGVPLYPIAQAMGHKDTRMLERVYGRQTPEQLAAVMARAMGLTQGVCSTFVSAPTETADPVDAVDDDGGERGLARRRPKSKRPTRICVLVGRCRREMKKCLDPESNQGHGDFQSPALPAELSRRAARPPFRAAEGGVLRSAPRDASPDAMPGVRRHGRPGAAQTFGTAFRMALPSLTSTLNSTRLGLVALAAISGVCLVDGPGDAPRA